MTPEHDWIDVDDALLFHAQLISVFGGATGIRDLALLEPALDRPRNLFGYGAEDLQALAAAYAHGITFDPPEEEAVVMVEGLAAGEVTQELFADWLRKHSA